jgi:hypothetical protein
VKEINEVLTYNAPPQAVFDLIATGAFQVELINHIGGRQPEVVEETVGADGSTKVVTRQMTGIELPGFAKKLIPANTTVTTTYDWGPPEADGSRRGTWAAEAKGAPVSIGGPTQLLSDGDGTRHVYGGQVKSSVPVVGGKLEGFARDNFRKELAKTKEFTAARLA